MNVWIALLVVAQVPTPSTLGPGAETPTQPSVRRIAPGPSRSQPSLSASPTPQAPAQADAQADEATPAWLTETTPAAGPVSNLDLSGLAMKIFLATLGVLAAATASIMLGRHWIQSRKPAELDGQQMRVIESRPLTARAALKLVDVAGQLVLVGVDAQGIRGMIRLSGGFEDMWDAAQQENQEQSDRNEPSLR